MTKDKPYFDLFVIVEWAAAIVFIISLFAGSGTNVARTTDFGSLPQNDIALLSWLDEQNRKDVKVLREDGSVTLKVTTGFSARIRKNFDDIPKPPWQSLGYPAPQGVRNSMSWKSLTSSNYFWVIGSGVLILLGQVRRRYNKLRQVERTTDDRA